MDRLRLTTPLGNGPGARMGTDPSSGFLAFLIQFGKMLSTRMLPTVFSACYILVLQMAGP